ncbi:MAG TPA: SgcJ/EcaC family oxidoreductase [Pirellulaceae bacterium]|nr:SgcJ/EcaC family oxidoreductase [Pirellulaceae bacterium]
MANTEANLRDAILAADQGFMQTFARGDAKAIATLYTNDGQLLPTHHDAVTGQEAIQEFWQVAIDSGIKTAQLDTIEVEGCGDTAIEVGKYRLGGEGEQLLDEGKYIVIWKRENGQWRLHRDIWNTSLPAPV